MIIMQLSVTNID